MRDRRLLSGLLLSSMVVLAPTAARTALAQDHQHASHGAPSGLLRLEVDGSKNPERVSDYQAYRQFIMATSVRDDSSEKDRKYSRAYIRRIGLSTRDEALLDAALRNVRERIDDVSAERQRLGAAAPTSSKEVLRQREEAVFDGANRRIRTFLSNDGWRRLDLFVQKHVKRRIKIYTGESR